jgi:DNA-binding response OmpR family regulator
MVLGGLVGLWYYRRQKIKYTVHFDKKETEYLAFGNSQLDVSGQLLLCNSTRQTLTFRETKLLQLFVTSPNQLLERDFILQQVWADEGVLVGRSIDVFVSRLRKKLAADPSVGIVAVHGVGYRLETGK